jgi:hypothetical protein
MTTRSSYYQVVLMPITVARGLYCWGRGEEEGDFIVCSHFDNEGGSPRCLLGLGKLRYNDAEECGWVTKPAECQALRIVE